MRRNQIRLIGFFDADTSGEEAVRVTSCNLRLTRCGDRLLWFARTRGYMLDAGRTFFGLF